MALVNLSHSSIPHSGKTLFDIGQWWKTNGLASLSRRSLASVAFITGYLLAIAALALTSIGGGFPWFVVMLVISLPLYALMAGDKSTDG